MASVNIHAFACAQAILGVGATSPEAVTFAAIAGAESSFGTNNWGDYGLGQPACHGYTSLGGWQINLPAHAEYLASVTHSSDPCTWAHWLLDLRQNAQAALSVFRSAGNRFTPWTTYQTGAYRAYLTTAEIAVAAALSSSPPTATSPPPASSSPTLPSTPGTFVTIAPYLVEGGIIIGVVLLGVSVLKGIRTA